MSELTEEKSELDDSQLPKGVEVGKFGTLMREAYGWLPGRSEAVLMKPGQAGDQLGVMIYDGEDTYFEPRRINVEGIQVKENSMVEPASRITCIDINEGLGEPDLALLVSGPKEEPPVRKTPPAAPPLTPMQIEYYRLAREMDRETKAKLQGHKPDSQLPGHSA